MKKFAIGFLMLSAIALVTQPVISFAEDAYEYGNEVYDDSQQESEGSSEEYSDEMSPEGDNADDNAEEGSEDQQ